MPRPSAGRNEHRRRRALVLVADDTVDVRDLYAEYFGTVGLNVITAYDGAAAFSTALQYRPDVIVMDLAMPRVDGITAIRNLRSDRRTRNVPVILLTGYPYKAIEHGVLEAGATVFLTKPCLPEDLERHVRRLLAQPRSDDAA